MSQPNAAEARRRFFERHGHYPGESAGAAAPVTPEQERVVREAIQSREKSYSGKDYMTLVEEYRDAKHCTLVDAMFAINKKFPEARMAYIKKANPHIQ